MEALARVHSSARIVARVERSALVARDSRSRTAKPAPASLKSPVVQAKQNL